MIEQIETEARKLYDEMEGIKLLFDNQPTATDLELCDRWMREVMAYYLRLGGIEPRAKGLFAQATVDVVTNCPEEQYKRFKSTNSMVETLVAAQYPHAAKCVGGCKNLMKLIEMTFENYRTLLASARKEKELAPRLVT